jgi:6-pyruvoyltetrahydropterin/6-carboxytetrahydropterin synthase
MTRHSVTKPDSHSSAPHVSQAIHQDSPRTPNGSQGTFKVLLQKEQLVFSSAHFITFAGDICECLHGHNYGLRGEVEGHLDENRYVIDFIAFRESLAELVRQLDHHMLLAMHHPMITVDAQEKEVTVRFKDKRWVFPREDCMLLPIANTTAEEIAWWIATRLRDKLYPSIGDRLVSIEIGVDENNGQWGYCRLPWIPGS